MLVGWYLRRHELVTLDARSYESLKRELDSTWSRSEGFPDWPEPVARYLLREGRALAMFCGL